MPLVATLNTIDIHPYAFQIHIEIPILLLPRFYQLLFLHVWGSHKTILPCSSCFPFKMSCFKAHLTKWGGRVRQTASGERHWRMGELSSHETPYVNLMPSGMVEDADRLPCWIQISQIVQSGIYMETEDSIGLLFIWGSKVSWAIPDQNWPLSIGSDLC